MNKCQEEFLAQYKISNIKMDLSDPLNPCHSVWRAWQAAWNARGKVDAEICRDRIGPLSTPYDIEARECAEAIEKEDEHG